MKLLATFSKGFDIVKEAFARQRRPAYIERAGEDRQTSTHDRLRIINLHRDMLRNSPEAVSQDQQVRVNTVGTVGGKLHANFKDNRAAADEVMRFFNRRWARHAEFTYGLHFNKLLKGVLTALSTNGNLILVFDDGILTGGAGTGRIRGFEGDEIANVPPDEFAKRFPKTYTQREGFVYNEAGIFCGAFVSTSQRGRKCFDPAAGFITLKFDPFDDETVPNWVALGDMRRFNQGRSIPPATSALATLVDLHEARSSETQAAKLNAQMVGQILSTETDPGDGGDNGAFGNPGQDGGEAETREYTLNNLKTIGAKLDETPPGKRIELFDTKRPNANFPAFAEYLQGVQGATRGLTRVYSTLRVQNSYTGFRGEQKIAELSFQELQKNLEREVCDWAARLAIARAVAMGLIATTLPEYWWEHLAWTWPRMPEVSEKDYQLGIQQALKNGTTSLHRLLSPGEYEELREERRQEAADAREDGIVYEPAVTVSGQVADAGNKESDNNDSEKENNDPHKENQND